MNRDDSDLEEMEDPEEESFADLLNETLIKSERLEPGSRVTAQVIKIADEWVFIDLGSKSEGYIERKEFMDNEGNLTVNEGDTLQAYFLSNKEGDLLFTTKLGTGDAGRAHMEDAWRNGIPVEGMIEKEIKGGFEVKIMGTQRAFCPFSQMGLQRVQNSSEWVGKRLPFRITEFGERGRNIIVSHRSILEEEREALKDGLKNSLKEGALIRGTVTSLRDFGAFVDIGGIEGLIPISEMAWGNVEKVEDVLSAGQEVEVIITRLDWEKNRISLSLKETLPDPWETAEPKYPTGSEHRGKVVRLTNFGAFVSLSDGIDGLLHISRLGAGKRISHPREIVSEGQEIDVKIDSVDVEKKRISLSLALTEKQQVDEKEEKETFKAHLEQPSKSMGSLGDLLRAKMEERDGAGGKK